jgi:hypothetical protein
VPISMTLLIFIVFNGICCCYYYYCCCCCLSYSFMAVAGPAEWLGL